MRNVDDFIQSFLSHDVPQFYDPVKAHEYYIKNRDLKGRQPSASNLKTDNQRQGWNYAKSQINEAQKTDLKSASEANKAAIEKVRNAAEAARTEIRGKLAVILGQLTQGRKDRAAVIAEKEKADILVIAQKQKEALQKVAEKKAERLKEISDEHAIEVKRISDETKKKIKAASRMPDGTAKSEKLDEIRADSSAARNEASRKADVKKDEASSAFADEGDAIRNEAQNQKNAVRDKASKEKTDASNETDDNKDAQNATAKSERDKVALDAKLSIESARKNYESLKEDLKTNYEATAQTEFQAIKSNVK